MRLLGFEVTRTKQQALSPVYGTGGNWMGLWGIVRESFAGAWQRNIECESTPNILAFSAVYACISLIADDIAKLRIKLTERRPSGVWVETTNPAYSPVLRKPNRYQTRLQFVQQWMTSKLTYGNTYVLKSRDARTVVDELYVLDPRYVTPLVADDGDVWYQVGQYDLAGVRQQTTFPASAIIHDRCVALFHPLMGVSPLYAAGSSATQGIKIQNNSARFFQNMSRPSGQLTAPGTIDNVTAARLKEEFEAGFTGGNIGRLFVGGDGLKFEPFTIPPIEAQMIEQLGWTVEDIARPFHVPLYKLGGESPKFTNAAQLNQDYYDQCLQVHIEAIESLLDEGLRVPDGLGVELDLDGLLRMDPVAKADANQKRIGAGYLKPNEARRSENLEPVEGGDTPYMQQQNWPLAQLAERPAPDTTPAAAPAPPAPRDETEEEPEVEMAAALIAKFQFEATKIAEPRNG